MAVLPELPDDWEPTRASLHAYALAIDAIPRTHGVVHPRWWHISLKVGPTGLATDPVPLPGSDRTVTIRMDLHDHDVVMQVDGGDEQRFPMTAGLTGTEMADRLIAAAADLGLHGDYSRDKFENSDPRTYEPEHAAVYFEAVSLADQLFETRRAAVTGEVSPVQIWPHNFDMSFEWFGTRLETYEEGGETKTLPGQINLGFYPAGRAYFYSNPWPFDAAELTGHPLPHGASWHREGWEGSILYYDQVAGDPDGLRKVNDYAATVYELASPLLTA